jgi:hypothetical protein
MDGAGIGYVYYTSEGSLQRLCFHHSGCEMHAYTNLTNASHHLFSHFGCSVSTYAKFSPLLLTKLAKGLLPIPRLEINREL